MSPRALAFRRSCHMHRFLKPSFQTARHHEPITGIEAVPLQPWTRIPTRYSALPRTSQSQLLAWNGADRCSRAPASSSTAGTYAVYRSKGCRVSSEPQLRRRNLDLSLGRYCGHTVWTWGPWLDCMLPASPRYERCGTPRPPLRL